VTPQTVIGREAVGRQHLKKWDTVSRRHVQFFYEGGKWYLQDMGSTNGTYHNDRLLRAGRVELKAGDRIGLGASLTLRVEILKGD
jgi:pSer/pThr/pTyr-binding forkhead associated (FHA) protein